MGFAERGDVACLAAVGLVGLLLGGCRQAGESSSAGAQPPGLAASANARADITVREPDAFYEPPSGHPGRPGALLRSEPLKNVTLPAGMQGWRILYATTVDDRTPATAAATVFAPLEPPPGPRPVITWTHGTTGLMQKCMPSLVSAPTEGVPARDGVLAEGWVVVATDYSFAEKGGPHPYLIGEGEARAALDSVRATRQMPELVLDERTVAWGHSQGGHSALWTAIVAPRYAPEVKLLGVAAIAPAADMRRILAVNEQVDKRLGPYLASAYSRFYPDLHFDEAVRPEALQAAREIARLCGFFPREDAVRINDLTATFDGGSLAMGTSSRLAALLDENVADRPIGVPVVIAQGLSDAVVRPQATDAYVKERCGAGQVLEYWTFDGRDHGTIVQPGTPLERPLLSWTRARFANQPGPGACRRATY